MSFTRSTHYVRLNSGSDGVPYIPGDGNGAALARVVAAKNITAINTPTNITLNNVTSMSAGQLVISTDGYWGTIASVDAPNNKITVHKWNSHIGKLSSPAIGTGNLNVFPTGSILANMNSVRIERFIVTKSITGVSANYIFDHRMATATPVLEYNSVVGLVGSEEVGMDITSPFSLQIGTLANCNITVVFSMN